MKRYRIALAVMTLVAALTVTGTPSSSARTVVSIAGLWHGSWTSSLNPSSSGHWTVHFHQNGSHVSGTITINPGCVTQGSVHGTITGLTITFGQVSDGRRTVTFRGYISSDGTHMHGTYRSPQACGSDHGTWRGHHA